MQPTAIPKAIAASELTITNMFYASVALELGGLSREHRMLSQLTSSSTSDN
jgi:hypothetical protein